MRRFCALVSSLLTIFLQAQAAQEILNAHFKHSGGEKAWNQLNSVYMKGTVQIGLSDEIPIEIYQKRPYYKKIIFVENGKTRLSEGFDGKNAFTFSESLNKNVKIPNYSPDAFETDYFNYEKKGFSVKKKADTLIDDTPVYHLELMKNTQRVQLYFSKKDYSLIQEENENEVIIYREDKIFKGLKFSTEIETLPKDGATYVLRIRDVIPNLAMPDKTFQF